MARKNKPVLTPTERTIRRTRRTLTGGRWFLIIGLVFYSLMTTTPFVARHSEWEWSGFVLGLIVDAAFIMALSAESTLAKYGIRKLGGWPAAFRWFAGLSSVFLNVWVSIEHRDPVGVAVHVIAPALVMLLAEVGPVYMVALADAEKTAERPAEPQPVPAEPESLPEPETATEREMHKMTGSGTISARRLDEPVADEPGRLPKAEADHIIEEGWKHKLTVKETAAAATRHPATVSRRFKQLDAELSV